MKGIIKYDVFETNMQEETPLQSLGSTLHSLDGFIKTARWKCKPQKTWNIAKYCKNL